MLSPGILHKKDKEAGNLQAGPALTRQICPPDSWRNIYSSLTGQSWNCEKRIPAGAASFRITASRKITGGRNGYFLQAIAKNTIRDFRLCQTDIR
jgi:hypothetical protein